MKLTKAWLKEAATTSSLYKGDNFYEEVGELKKEQNKYTAIVFGEIIYDVQIEENELDIDCFCTCDFDTGGLCAHAVAVCLNILDGQYEEIELETQADFEETVAIIDYRLKDGKNFYKNVFKTATENTQDNFLQQLFEHNEFLRKNFLELQQNHEKYKVSIDITSLRKNIFDQLLSVDFSKKEAVFVFPLNGQKKLPNNTLLKEEKAIEQIEQVLNPYGEKALEFLANGQLTNALTVYLGMFEASFGLPEPEWEEASLIDDFEAETMTICQNWQATIIEEIQDTTLEVEQIKRCIDLIFDRWQLHHGDKSLTDVYYDFKFFEPFLLAILTPTTAQYLKNLLAKNQLINYQTAQISLHCADLLKQEDWWLEIGENFAGNDPKIAEKLMQKYHQLNQMDEFYRIARYTFDLFPDKLTSFLLKHIHPKVDRPFYVELLTFYANKKQDIEAFKELREFISLEAKEVFIQNNATNPTFYTQLLATELRFSEILELAKTQKNAWEFNELVRPILNIYPRDIFEMHVKRTIENLTLHATTRLDYRRICKNLVSIKEIKGYDDTRKEFIKRLKKQFKHRTEFLEELAAVGF